MRLAIIGSSHVGAVKQAAPRVLAECPDLQVTFFAMPGAAFVRMGTDADGVLRIAEATPKERDLSQRVNGSDSLDLTPFERVWVIGGRFGFAAIMRLFLEHDVLEWPPTGRDRTMSEAFGATVLETLVEEVCASLESRFGRDPRIVLTPVPYICESALSQGKGMDKWISKIFVHPHAARIEAMFETAIRDGLAERGMQLMLQPDSTRVLHMATKAEFVHDARDFSNEASALNDLRHMNADFGYQLFRILTELHLKGPQSKTEATNHGAKHV